MSVLQLNKKGCRNERKGDSDKRSGGCRVYDDNDDKDEGKQRRLGIYKI